MTNESQNSLLSLRGELQKQLDFINEVIEADREKLEAYKQEHGDLYYRPKIGNQGLGNPTEVLLTPLVVQFRATIKSILDSIVLVDRALSGTHEEAYNHTDAYSESHIDQENWDAKDWLLESKGKNKK